MAWIKIPTEHHPIFHKALPKDPSVTTLNMFGGVAAMVNGNMFGGLFARSLIVKIDPQEQHLLEEIEGTEVFDPMGNGRVMHDMFLLGESVMEDPKALALWLKRAFKYVSTLPAKPKKKAVKGVEKTPVKKAASQKKKKT